MRTRPSDRVARRLKAQGRIDILPAQDCYVVAKFVMLESLRQVHRELISIPATISPIPDHGRAEEVIAERERAMEGILEACLASERPENVN